MTQCFSKYATDLLQLTAFASIATRSASLLKESVNPDPTPFLM